MSKPSKFYEAFGMSKSLRGWSDWVLETQGREVEPSAIRYRIERGYTMEVALSPMTIYGDRTFTHGFVKEQKQNRYRSRGVINICVLERLSSSCVMWKTFERIPVSDAEKLLKAGNIIKAERF